MPYKNSKRGLKNLSDGFLDIYVRRYFKIYDPICKTELIINFNVINFVQAVNVVDNSIAVGKWFAGLFIISNGYRPTELTGCKR